MRRDPRRASVPEYLLAIDQGTTSTRAIVFDSALVPVASAQQELRQIYPAPGLVEHDAEEIWSATLATVRTAMGRANAQAKDIAALGITNQRETAVIWDRATNCPIHNAIVWQDRRTADRCAALRQDGHEALITAPHRSCARPLFFRHQDRVLARSRRGRAGGGACGPACLRDCGQFPALAAHWRAGARE